MNTKGFRMSTISTKYGIISTEINLDVDVTNPSTTKRTLQDFNGDIGMFELYKKMENIFQSHEDKTKNILDVNESNKEK